MADTTDKTTNDRALLAGGFRALITQLHDLRVVASSPHLTDRSRNELAAVVGPILRELRGELDATLVAVTAPPRPPGNA